MAEWWEELYSEEFLCLMGDRIIPDKKIQEDCNFIEECISGAPGKEFLDVGCGFGFYSQELAKRGYSLTGIDLSKPSIEYAKNLAKKSNLQMSFILQDLRNLKAKKKYDAAFQFFSSFGYCDKFEDNLLILSNISNSLKRGGLYLLELNNIFGVTKIINSQFPARLWIKSSKGDYNLREAHFEIENQRWVVQDQYILKDGSSKELTTKQYFFTPQQIIKHLKDVGLEVQALFGNTQKEPFHLDSELLYIVSEKI